MKKRYYKVKLKRIKTKIEKLLKKMKKDGGFGKLTVMELYNIQEQIKYYIKRYWEVKND